MPPRLTAWSTENLWLVGFYSIIFPTNKLPYHRYNSFAECLLASRCFWLYLSKPITLWCRRATNRLTLG